MESKTADLFHLTETEFFKNLRQGLLSEDLHVHLRDLIISIHEVTAPNSPYSHCALEMLICADLSFAIFKNNDTLGKANKALADAVDRAHQYVLNKLNSLGAGCQYVKPQGDPLVKSQLTWTRDKSRFAQFCHMVKVGKLVHSEDTMEDIVQVLGPVFGLDMSTQYVRNRISALKYIDADKSMTPFLDEMKEAVISHMTEELNESYSH